MSISAPNSKQDFNTLVKSLCTFLADTYLLFLKTQNFHWNVTGSRFHFLHTLFEEQYNELSEAVDIIAERIRALQKKAPGTMREFLELTSLQEAAEYPNSEEMICQLLNDHEAICKSLQNSIVLASKLGDEGTADLFIERLRVHEKTAWMLRSHADEEPSMDYPI